MPPVYRPQYIVVGKNGKRFGSKELRMNAMAEAISSLEARYVNSCKRQEVHPSFSVLSSLYKAKLQKICQELCCLEIFLDHLKDADFPPLVDLFSAISLSEVDAVDILHESPGVVFNGESVLSLMCAVGQKLRIVDLQDLSFGKDFLRDLSQRGLPCQVINLRSPHIRKLDMTGRFMQLQTLNLDFSTALTSFREGCFCCMPNLMRVSLCETRISNLWTTSAALSKLPSLVELRFQNCLCCNDTGPCQASSGGKDLLCDFGRTSSGQFQSYSCTHETTNASEKFWCQNDHYSETEDIFSSMPSDDDSYVNHELFQSASEESSDSELELLSHQRRSDYLVEKLSGDHHSSAEDIHLGCSLIMDNLAVSFCGSSLGQTTFEFCKEVHCSDRTRAAPEHKTLEMNIVDLSGKCLNGHSNIDSNSCVLPIDDKEGPAISSLDLVYTVGSTDIVTKKYVSHHPSPICFEKFYREYIIASLPRLKVLDNLPVGNEEREAARIVISQYYEFLPYNRQFKENIVNALLKREMGTGTGLRKFPKRSPYSSEMSHYSFTRSISAAKVGSSAWPSIRPISKIRSTEKEEVKSFRPRQFEYHPCNPDLMVFGTLDGELIVINHESGKLVGYLPSVGALHSVLGLCWLKTYPSKLIAGSDNGSLQLYDISQMPSTFVDGYCCTDAAKFSFDEFEQLTSVHVNSTDECFLVSGYSKHVALYDIGSGRRLQIFKHLHREHINVVKFAHHSPSIFATSSFDQEVKLWDLRQRPLQPCYTASSSRGNVMVCFSPDDHYLLSSAVDNEVKQHFAVDGRLHMKFNIAATGSAQNYTRSYYMNGRDYIISGSCEENVVRICCAQTGRRLRDISLEGRGSRNSIFVQSLRGDPFWNFNMSILAAYPSSKSEIIKVNLLASGDYVNHYYTKSLHPSYGMGG